MPEPILYRFAREPDPCAHDNIGINYIGTDIEGVVTGGNHNFCSLPLSAYRSGAFDNIWKFEITSADDIPQPVYCLEKGLRGSQGSPYRSMPIEQCLPGLAPAQIERLNWIFANGYPAVDAGRMFACAGVDAALSPALTNDDAYAAVQVALWSAINPPADTQTGWRFLDCVSGAPHAKSARLRQTVAYLYENAVTRGREPAVLPDLTAGVDSYERVCGRRVARVGVAMLTDCGPGAMAEVCGKILYGPLMVRSGAPFTLELRALCESECAPGFITLADGCGAPIRFPASDQEFYIAFPSKSPASCYELSLNAPRNVATVAVLCNIDAPPRLQAVGFVPRMSTRYDRASLCLCFSPPCRECPPVPCCLCTVTGACHMPCDKPAMPPTLGLCPPSPCLQPQPCEWPGPNPRPWREPYKRTNMRKREKLI